jgi:hypothetical protein
MKYRVEVLEEGFIAGVGELISCGADNCHYFEWSISFIPDFCCGSAEF